jgi:predicted HicB family RNase H-like nuclease
MTSGNESTQGQGSGFIRIDESGPRTNRTSIDFQQLLAGLEQPLQLVTDPQRRQELEAYISAARPHVERAAFDVLSQVITAFNDASHDLKARLEYTAAGLQLVTQPEGEAAPERSFSDEDLEKVTLRLPKELKELIDRAAGTAAMSANNWYVRELSRVISRHVNESMRDAWREQRDAWREQRDAMREEQRDARRRGFYRGRGSSLKGSVGD